MRKSRKLIFAVLFLLVLLTAIAILIFGIISLNRTIDIFITAIENKDFPALQVLFYEPQRVYENNQMVLYHSKYSESADQHTVLYLEDRQYAFSRISGYDIASIHQITSYIVMNIVYADGRSPLYFRVEMEFHGLSWTIVYIEVDI